jgi:diguanylate cyclase (GGDEF)-like protein
VKKKRQLPISVIMADLNNLKYLNDNYGHDTGDRALIKTAEILRESCRSEDLVGRWGGDEFILLLPGLDEQGVKQRIETIRALCCDEQIDGNQLSCALGAVVKTESEEDLVKYLKIAEERMYEDKRGSLP